MYMEQILTIHELIDYNSFHLSYDFYNSPPMDPRTEEQHLKNRRQEEHWRNRFKHEERLRNRRIEDKYHRTDDDDSDIK